VSPPEPTPAGRDGTPDADVGLDVGLDRDADAGGAIETLDEVERAALLDDLAAHERAAHPGGLDETESAGGAARHGAMWVLRRGISSSPDLRRGIAFTVALAMVGAAGRLSIPILIQQVTDRAIVGVDEFDSSLVIRACLATAAVVIVVAVASRAAYVRLVVAAEAMLYHLRVRAFAHIHELSIADHNETKRGELTSRVTSDIEIIAMFAQWAGVAWIVNSIVILGTLAVMAVYSWQLTLITILVFLPILPAMRFFQRRQLTAYLGVRDRVGDTMSEISETVQGAAVIRAYGVEARSRRRLAGAIDRQYRAEMGAARYFALMFPLADLFSGAALTAVIVAGTWYGADAWGLDVGTMLAFVFLVNLIITPIAELSEILDQTQQGLAGWGRVFDLLDIPVDVVEPDPGVTLPAGALSVRADGLSFAYREGGRVLDDIDLDIPAGTAVAVVGETGSGKTTFAKLLCRFADPTEGRLLIGGVDLREVAKSARNAGVRMVPQDGFLFDTTVRENVRQGRPDATDAEVVGAFARLGLDDWVARLPAGLDTDVGERGGNLSVGERQLVALARAQLADPGLLVLDEATSAVDPETERALTEALHRLAEGRTTISIAHRLSTAEAADLILVFDQGRIVEQGHHDELVAAGGRYGELYASWLGNTRAA
jgi:ABC-type multidrug transport system fused ATPase/permease subunit